MDDKCKHHAVKCLECGKQLDSSDIAKIIGSNGGSKSKRVLTSEQAREMAVKSAEARKKK